jgi:hypothetical protein
MALPTQRLWSTRTRTFLAIAVPYCQLIGSDFSDRKVMLG